MKNPYEVLRQKEAELARMRHEIDCLRIAAPLLSEELTSSSLNSPSEGSEKTRVEQEPEPKARVLKRGQ
jgi:hypothetical protein